MTRFFFCIGFILLMAANHSVAQEPHSQDITLDSLLSLPVSTAAKYQQTSAEAPASISVITSAEIESFHYKTLSDVLNRVRGMYISNDRNYVYVGIRGFSRPTDYNNRILLLVDGHTLNENVYGSAMLGSEFGISLDAIERIEIVRGPGSALYGTGAMFGVINVITKDFHDVNGVTAAVGLGSVGHREASLLYGKEFSHSSGILVSANYGHEDGADIYFPEYDTDTTHHGIATNLDWDTYYGITAKITLPHLVLRSGFMAREKGIPTASFGTIFNDPRAQSLDARQFVDLQYTTPVKEAMELSLRVYGDGYHYAGVYPYAELSRDQSTGLWWGSEGRLQWDLAANDRMVIGSEFQDHLRSDYIASYGSTQIFSGDGPFSVISAYAQNEFQWSENLSITGGIRYDHYTTCGATVSPRLAVIWNEREGGAIKFLVGRAFRAPNFYEMNYIDPASEFKDNPLLTPEIITTWEVALEQRLSDQVHASVSFYRYAMSNLIDQAIDPADSMMHFQNQSEITARGVEFEIEYQPDRSLHCYGIVSTQVAKNSLTLSSLTNSPAWLARMGVSYQMRSWLEASLEGTYDSGRLTVYETTTPTATLVHAKMTCTPIVDRLKFSLGIRNLFDTHIYFPGGFEHLQPMIPQTGRELLAKIVWSL
jgi:outer membrane receptor for ferrienterochelin and colicins